MARPQANARLARSPSRRLSYALAFRGELPAAPTLVGAALLVAGVLTALRIKPVALSAQARPN